MSVVALREGTTLVRSEWASQLGIESPDLQALIDSRVLQPTEQGEYALALVGIVVFNDGLLLGQPKFGAGGSFALPRTLEILRGYFARSALRTPLVDHVRDPEYGDLQILREFDALSGLLRWFGAHGLYRREQFRASSLGRSDWTRTIVKRLPVAVQGTVFYPDVIAERREGVLNDISSLQVGILARLLERYGLPVPAEIRHAELAAGSVVDQWPLRADTKAYFQRRVAKEQRDVFRTDALQLLNLLSAALDTRLAEITPHPQIYGTTAFYAVWEDACKLSFGSGTQSVLQDALGQPVWFTPDLAGRKRPLVHAQIPDLVLIWDHWLFIIDAKYYYPFPISRPGGPDIVKQVYYAESLKQAHPKVCSIFIMPLPDALNPRFLGYATINGADREFPKVEAWGIDPDCVFDCYPSISPNRADHTITAILGLRNTVTEFVCQTPSDVSC